jgi:hypothetical protein
MSYQYEVVDLEEAVPVYAGVETADLYLSGATHGQSWFVLDDDSKGRALVTATRTLDRQQWKGDLAETSPLQALDWPRINTGVVGVVDTEIPIDIIHASIEMALELSQGSSVQTETNVGQRIESLKAGSVAITYFGGASVSTTQRFPTIIDELISPYLLSAGDATTANSFGAISRGLAGVAYGTDGETETDNNFGVTSGM